MNQTTRNVLTPGEKIPVFEIKDCALVAIATGSRAVNLKELRDTLSIIDLDSIYYHFWGNLLQPRFEEREYNNDFAAWAWHGLHDHTLAERLAVVDPNEFISMEDLRQELLEVVEERMDDQGQLSLFYATTRFEFIRSQIVVFDTQKRADTPEKLAATLPTLTPSSIFYHFIDARRRLPHHRDDFSSWLGVCGKAYEPLGVELAGVDPYFGSLTQLKVQLQDIFDRFFQGGSEQ